MSSRQQKISHIHGRSEGKLAKTKEPCCSEPYLLTSGVVQGYRNTTSMSFTEREIFIGLSIYWLKIGHYQPVYKMLL